jgi:hypothetical protein
MAIWHAGRLHPDANRPGWLARALDEGLGRPSRDAPALHVSSELLPHALYGGQHQVPSLLDLGRFRRRLGMPEGAGAAQQRTALDQVAALDRGSPGSLLQFVQRSTVLSYTSSDRLEHALRGESAAARYPDNNGLGQRLRLVAQLIKAGLDTSIYYTQLGGFDTHANQQGTHFGLLREMGDALQAFVDDLSASGDAKRVLVLVFSEFGRRLTENASGGTDHGPGPPAGRRRPPGAARPLPEPGRPRRRRPQTRHRLPPGLRDGARRLAGLPRAGGTGRQVPSPFGPGGVASAPLREICAGRLAVLMSFQRHAVGGRGDASPNRRSFWGASSHERQRRSQHEEIRWKASADTLTSPSSRATGRVSTERRPRAAHPGVSAGRR